jgi:PAS domain S-box-containing protein
VIHILLVDDEPTFLTVSRMFLEEEPDLRVEICESASKAMELLCHSLFDVIVSDYDMPGMSGIELLKVVRTQDSDIPFILLTGRGREEVVIEALNNGADFYMQKGYDPQALYVELVHKIRHAVEKRQAQERLALALDASNDAIVDWNIKTGEMYWSPRYLAMLGYAPDEFPHSLETWKHLVHPEDREFMANLLNDLLENRTDYAESEYRMRTGSGGWAWIFSRLKAILRDSAGTPLRIVGTHTDITGRRRAGEALRESEERYRSLVELSPDGIILQQGGVVTYANPAALKLFGASSPEDLIGMNSTELAQPEFRRDVAERIRDLEESGYIGPRTIKIRRLDGQSLDVESTGSLVYRDGVPSGQIVVRDITERIRADERIKESEEKYRRFFEDDLTGDSITTPDGRILTCNDAFVRMFGFSSNEEARKSNILDTYEFPEDRTGFLEHLRREGKLENYGRTRRRKDGSLIHVIENVTGRFDENGELTEIWGYQYDNSEQHRAEEELKRSEEKLRALFRLLPIGVSILDEHQKIVDVNPSLEEILGLSSDALKSGEYEKRQYLRPDGSEMPAEEFQSSRAFAGQSDARYTEIGIVKEDGATIWTDVSAVPLPFADWRVVITTSDITRRKYLEEALKEANKKLNLLTSITRHDVLNQIMTLKGFLSLLERRVPEDPETKRLVSQLRLVAKTMERHISFTRDYQHMGEYDPEWQRVDQRVLRAAEGVRLDGARLTVATGPLEVFADPMLEKAFFNLLENAVVHGEGVTEIRVSFYDIAGGSGVIVVEDDGVGVPASMKSDIFEKGVGKITGYGLFLVKEILDITRLGITEAGEEGKGARFEIVVPKGKWRISEEVSGDDEGRPESHRAQGKRKAFG